MRKLNFLNEVLARLKKIHFTSFFESIFRTGKPVFDSVLFMWSQPRTGGKEWILDSLLHSYRYVSEDLKTARGPVRTAINGLVHHTASLYDSLVVRSMTPSLSLPDASGVRGSRFQSRTHSRFPHPTFSKTPHTPFSHRGPNALPFIA